MARIDDPISDKFPENIKILVYGENSQSLIEPHFHVVRDNFEFEVYIHHIHNLEILRTTHTDRKVNESTWKERTVVRTEILEWFDKPNTELSPMTNAGAILAQWNLNNPEHKIPHTFKD